MARTGRDMVIDIVSAQLGAPKGPVTDSFSPMSVDCHVSTAGCCTPWIRVMASSSEVDARSGVSAHVACLANEPTRRPIEYSQRHELRTHPAGDVVDDDAAAPS